MERDSCNSLGSVLVLKILWPFHNNTNEPWAQDAAGGWTSVGLSESLSNTYYCLPSLPRDWTTVKTWLQNSSTGLLKPSHNQCIITAFNYSNYLQTRCPPVIGDVFPICLRLCLKDQIIWQSKPGTVAAALVPLVCCSGTNLTTRSSKEGWGIRYCHWVPYGGCGRGCCQSFSVFSLYLQTFHPVNRGSTSHFVNTFVDV